MLKKIFNSIKEGSFFDKAFNKINVILKKTYIKSLSKKTPIDSKKVIFITFQGKYTCNPKAIADEFIKRNSDYTLVWAIGKEDKKNISKFPKELKLVVKGSNKFYKELASSKFIIENANDTAYMGYSKRKEQIVIQTWHGSLGFKRLDTSDNENWVKKVQKLGKETDYIISNSEFENMVYRTSYWSKTEILEYGHARNDVLLDQKQYLEANKKVREFYDVPKNTKIALYAPTFRDDFDLETFDINYSKLLDAIKKRFGGEWLLMVRFHYKLRNIKFPKELEKQVVNATDYYDMQELLCAADLGITDYSSWICDYVLTNKPGFLYANDINKYINERGFYYSLSETPFPICNNNDELYDNIIKFDEKKYLKDREKFLNERGCFEKGNASKKIVDFIYELNKK